MLLSLECYRFVRDKIAKYKGCKERRNLSKRKDAQMAVTFAWKTRVL